MITIKETYQGPLLLYPVFSDHPTAEGHQEILDRLLRSEKFIGEKNTLFLTTEGVGNSIKTLLFFGLGQGAKDRDLHFQETLRMAVGFAYKKASSLKEKEAGLYIPQSLQDKESLESIATALVLSSFAFDKYLSVKKYIPLENLVLFGAGLTKEQGVLEEGILLGEMTNLARTLSTEPGDVVFPESLGETATQLGNSKGFLTTIYGKEEIEALRMMAFLAVARGSSYEPRLIVMEYTGNPGASVMGLVGKGITFDSGGLSLKPAGSMLTMQGDMSGAASVIAAMGAIAGMKLPINVVAVVAACDNSVAGNSYRPNDILTSRSGKTIFVANTDAEGRLTLIDALDYILTEKKVDRVVDIATLTGAAEVALGQKIAAVLTNNEAFLEELKQASRETGERVWELPHDEDFLKLIESPYADLTNSGGRYGGTITAGLFLGSVVGQTPWLHIDIAGPSWSEKDHGYLSKGGTGFGTRLLYRLLKNTLR